MDLQAGVIEAVFELLLALDGGTFPRFSTIPSNFSPVPVAAGQQLLEFVNC